MNDLEKLADEIIIENEPFVITDEWLMKHRTEKRAWTMKQLKVLGIQWPPKGKWKRGMIGTEISKEDKARFEEHKHHRK